MTCKRFCMCFFHNSLILDEISFFTSLGEFLVKGISSGFCYFCSWYAFSQFLIWTVILAARKQYQVGYQSIRRGLRKAFHNWRFRIIMHSLTLQILLDYSKISLLLCFLGCRWKLWSYYLKNLVEINLVLQL